MPLGRPPAEPLPRACSGFAGVLPMCIRKRVAMAFADDEYVSLSALQHYVFCPRQCALIHNERLWAENALTTMGKLEHERVDTAPGTTRGALRTARGVLLACHRLGIRGVADAIEYERTAGQGGGQEDGLCRVTPVEYKHGRPKEHQADAVQLCAQAFCLEEMHGIDIPVAYIYYRTTRRRQEVLLDAPLRERTEAAIVATRALLVGGTLPAACKHAECESCSLVELCLPLPSRLSAAAYNERNFSQVADDI